MTEPSHQTVEQLHEAAFNIGILASFCEKSEHLEPKDDLEVLYAPEKIRTLGALILVEMGYDPFEEYVQKIRLVEEKNFYGHDPNAPKFALGADPSTDSWRDLQSMQQLHDGFYHPDVVGSSPLYHLNHTVLHLSKTIGYILGSIGKDSWPSVAKRRTTDMIIFSVKAATALHIEAPDTRD